MPQKGLEWHKGELEPNCHFWVNYRFKCVFKHFTIQFLISYVVSNKIQKEKLMSQSVIYLLLLYGINVEII